MESSGQSGLDSEWEELSPTKNDPHQHRLSIVGFFLLFLGPGISSIIANEIILPALIGISCMVYGGAVGNTWYREEMLPYLDRRVDVSDVEARRFLSFIHYSRISILISGLLGAVPSDIVFRYYWNLILPLAIIDPIVLPLSLLLLLCTMGLFIVQIVLWVKIFNRVLSSNYSDISHLIAIKEKWEKTNKKRMNERNKMGPVQR